MDATGNGVLIFLAALVPILALGALLTDLLLANAPRRGKRPDVAAPAPADVVPAARAAAPRNFPTPRTVLVIAHVALGGRITCVRPRGLGRCGRSGSPCSPASCSFSLAGACPLCRRCNARLTWGRQKSKGSRDNRPTRAASGKDLETDAAQGRLVGVEVFFALAGVPGEIGSGSLSGA
jgi:hypothetical protein